MVALRPVILASSSETRRKMLADSGLVFETAGVSLDEEELKGKLETEGVAGEDFPLALARAKALEVSEKHGTALVIGADQILECGDKRFDKPGNHAEARRQLGYLSGKTHSLTSAVCVLCEGKEIWTHCDYAHLTMRLLSSDFIDSYLEDLGEEKLFTTGLYQIEGPGNRLFLSVKGDFFTILVFLFSPF